jgi:hypothetical protein
VRRPEDGPAGVVPVTASRGYDTPLSALRSGVDDLGAWLGICASTPRPGADQDGALAMQNPTTDDQHSAYYSVVGKADADLEEALSRLRAEQDAHSITAVQAAAERVGLLERHLKLCQQARLEHLEHLGGTP